MKVAELVAAFQRFATAQNNTGSATPGEPQPAQTPAVKADAAPPRPAPELDDRITVSPEAIFTFAASRFDPQRITRHEIDSLADILHEGGAISLHDRAVLASRPDGRIRTAIFESNPDIPTNLVNEFQGRLAHDMANANIGAVEEDTRALSILGRLASIRDEL
jgi:hypothetical protein